MALDAMQFAQGAPAQFGAPPQAGGQGGYAPAYPQQGGFAPGGGAYAPPPPQPGYGGQPQYGGQPGYAPAAPAPYQQPGYAPPPGPGPAPMTEPSAGAVAQPGAKVLRGFLISYQTNAQGDFWPLHTGRLTVGRSNSGESLDIPLADATISSRHAVLTVDSTTGSVQVEDTGSTNGTFVNDEHLGFNGRRELRDGDRVRFGGFTTIVKVIARP